MTTARRPLQRVEGGPRMSNPNPVKEATQPTWMARSCAAAPQRGGEADKPARVVATRWGRLVVGPPVKKASLVASWDHLHDDAAVAPCTARDDEHGRGRRVRPEAAAAQQRQQHQRQHLPPPSSPPGEEKEDAALSEGSVGAGSAARGVFFVKIRGAAVRAWRPRGCLTAVSVGVVK